MPERQLRNGTISTEYLVLELDEFGDVQDGDFFETPDEAKAAAAATKLVDGIVAVVVERRRHRHPEHNFAVPRTFKVLHTRGDSDSLRRGGWID